ncbi:hypothetical protein LTR86_009700 [Recurvomyces mirabilis]|nr:hypothetical protein LTR86_009700 [Recurvomyces mirabilis]
MAIYHRDVQYSDESSLNTLEVCIPRPETQNPKAIWVVFIHGGAWRDPAVDSTSFRKTQDLLLRSPHLNQIAGLASINYRLSPYPAHPTDPSSPSDPSRNARHPDHVNDVLAAILYLQEKYHFEDRYILAGHSVGATVAFQVAMKRYWGSQYESTFALELNVVPPIAVLGVAGIYDIPALVTHHKDIPEYADFVSNANGSDPAVWKAVSPTTGDYDESWADGKLGIIAHSHDDELVEWDQAVLMHEALKAQGWVESLKERQVRLMPLKGKHDQIWEDGTELARAISKAVEKVIEIL